MTRRRAAASVPRATHAQCVGYPLVVQPPMSPPSAVILEWEAGVPNGVGLGGGLVSR